MPINLGFSRRAFMCKHPNRAEVADAIVKQQPAAVRFEPAVHLENLDSRVSGQRARGSVLISKNGVQCCRTFRVF